MVHGDRRNLAWRVAGVVGMGYLILSLLFPRLQPAPPGDPSLVRVGGTGEGLPQDTYLNVREGETVAINSGAPPKDKYQNPTAPTLPLPVLEDSKGPENGAYPGGTHPGGADGVTKVVLVTYYRGGSTFLGEIFNQNPAVFYWFEPLAWPVYNMAVNKQGLTQDNFYFNDNGTIREIPEDYIDQLVTVFQDIFSCNLGGLHRSILGHYFLVSWGKAVKGLPYANCYKQFPTKDPKLADSITSCLPWLVEACHNSRVRVAKTIRMPAFLAHTLAKRDPSIRFVYYHRDPRAMTVSRAKFSGYMNWSVPAEVEIHAIKQCSLSRHDAVGFADFPPESKPPLVMSYENFALDPIQSARKVYRYLNLNMPHIIYYWLDYHTTSNAANGPLGTTRNSTETALMWKKEIPKYAMDIFSKHCSDVLKTQGYS